jgi:carbonic anhydrase/acetyltransferase-like protein (isoleucine patch superfamily)
MDGAIIESNSVIAAGALISKDSVVPSGSVFAGVPAKEIKKVDTVLLEGEIHRISNNYNMYASWYDPLDKK